MQPNDTEKREVTLRECFCADKAFKVDKIKYFFCFSYCQFSIKSYEPCHEKTNILVFDQVRHKPGCTVTEDG